jgi:hypothetical protein
MMTLSTMPFPSPNVRQTRPSPPSRIVLGRVATDARRATGALRRRNMDIPSESELLSRSPRPDCLVIKYICLNVSVETMSKWAQRHLLSARRPEGEVGVETASGVVGKNYGGMGDRRQKGLRLML